MLSDHFTCVHGLGSKTLQTIKNLLACSLKDPLRIYSVSGGHHYLQITSDLSIAEFTDKLSKLQINFHDPDMVLPENQLTFRRSLLKSSIFHNFFPSTLLFCP